jgi:flagellar basal-body rod protein FlgG
MYDALYIAATGMRASQTQVDTIAHNVANVNTAGFRRNVVSFSEVSASVTPTGTDPILEAVRSNLASRGAGALASTALSTAGGELKQTGEKLDVAIDGAGFFEVVRADGSLAYTRAGSLRLNGEGLLTLADGTPLAARMQFPPDTKEIQVSSDGKVLANVGGDVAPIEIGQLDLVTFTNTAGLKAIGANLFVATPESGEARAGAPGEEGRGSLRQGFLEGSNVQLVEELVAMMLAQRAFELNGRVIQAADQMMQITNALYKA